MKEHGMSDSTATATLRVKTGLAEMLKGGVIMDVVTVEQAKIAEDAGAVAVMSLERVPADIRAAGGADVGRDALEGHDGHRARVLGDLRLFDRDDVHDHAALEHLGEAGLDAQGRGGRHVPRARPG